MSTRNLGCHYSLDGKSRRKPSPLKVFKEVNMRWKTWQSNICYENMIEVDMRVKAEFFPCFLSYYSNVWMWSEGLFVGNLHLNRGIWNFAPLSPAIPLYFKHQQLPGDRVNVWCGSSSSYKTINSFSTPMFRNSLISLWALQTHTFIELEEEVLISC